MLIIDNFDGGNFERTFRQPGSYGDIIRNIDPRDTVGGSRQYAFRLGNQELVEVNMNNRQGRHEVTWNYQNLNISSQLDLDYGAGEPMRVDMGFATSIQVDRDTTPDDINASGYGVFMRDANFKFAENRFARQRPDQGIEFFRSDFTADQGFDWSQIAFIRFKQTYEDFSQITSYRTLEIRAVPEPSTFWFLSASLFFAVGGARRKSRAQKDLREFTSSRR